jgi:Kef-type K+ transport system membrane component KefB
MKNTNYFFITVIIFTVITCGIVFHSGNNLSTLKLPETGHDIAKIATVNHPDINNTFTWLIIQLIIILSTAHVFGYLAKKIKQPAVIGEMIAGILLGPSLLGSIYPEIINFLFPVSSIRMLEYISQLGLMLFMFIVGVESGKQKTGESIKPAILISQSGIMIPFSFGLICAFYIYTAYAPVHTNFYSFATFIGISMSITAFPVLARIIQDRGIANSKLGALILTCAAIDDITAWCLLVLGVSLHTSQGFGKFMMTLLLSIFYITIIISLVKPILFKLFSRFSEVTFSGNIPVMLSILILFLSSLATDLIGIHLLFGAFLAGVITPDIKDLKHRITGNMEVVCQVLFLPVFFVVSGLRTAVNSLNNLQEWLIFLLLLGTAIAGKLLGCTLAARISGISWRTSLVIGIFMNTRGLMELIVLNIGYSLGIISKEIFTMMVLVAVVTTIMTGYLLNLVGYNKINTNIIQ